MQEQLLLSKRLFIAGSECCEKSDPVSAGMAISLFQDSIELFLWCLIKYLDAQVKDTTPFTQYFDLIEGAPKNDKKLKLPFRGRILELNKARVNFKHYGNLPDISEAKKHKTYAEEFLIQSSMDFLGENLFDASLTKLVPFPDIRECLMSAEECLKKDEIDGCLAELAKAKSLLFRRVSQFLPEPDSHLTDGDKILSAKGEIRYSNLFKYIKDYLGRVRESIITLAFGIQIRDYFYLNAVLPHAVQFVSGNWSTIKKRTDINKEQAQKALEILVNMAIKISSLIA
jgi:hypothetical protein